MSRETLVFVSPVRPTPTGNGLAMRADMLLRALRGRFDVSLVVDEVYSAPLLPGYEQEVPGGAAVGGGALVSGAFDVLFAFRLAAVPAALALRSTASFRELWLDLDEVESCVQERIAGVRLDSGDTTGWEQAKTAAKDARAQEARAGRLFDRILVSSEVEQSQVRSERATVHAVPNAIVLPTDTLASGPRDVWTVGFVGSLGYAPNEDAVCWFAHEILPRLAANADRPVEFVVAGVGTTPRIVAAGVSAGVRLLGAVPDIARLYERSDVMVLPLRAGGGTRTKALEAFAFGRPIVSTSLGVEGLQVADGVHAVLADDSEGLAAACLRVLRDQELSYRLTRCARSLVVRAHTAEAVETALAAITTSPVAGRGRRPPTPSPGAAWQPTPS